MMTFRNANILGLLIICLASSGCATKEEWNRFWDSFKDRGEQPDPNPPLASKSKALQGAIGEYVTIDGLRMTQARGYGLVVDLVDTGGVDGPSIVLEYIKKEVRRRQQIGEPGQTVEEILKGADSTAVEVTGLIPPAAKKGDRFDVIGRWALRRNRLSEAGSSSAI
jgi:hypothetical protein